MRRDGWARKNQTYNSSVQNSATVYFVFFPSAVPPPAPARLPFHVIQNTGIAAYHSAFIHFGPMPEESDSESLSGAPINVARSIDTNAIYKCYPLHSARCCPIAHAQLLMKTRFVYAVCGNLSLLCFGLFFFFFFCRPQHHSCQIETTFLAIIPNRMHGRFLTAHIREFEKYKEKNKYDTFLLVQIHNTIKLTVSWKVN